MIFNKSHQHTAYNKSSGIRQSICLQILLREFKRFLPVQTFAKLWPNDKSPIVSHNIVKTTLVIIIFSSCLTIFGQDIPIPENYVILDTVSGDLDNDGKKELVVAYNTTQEDESYKNIPRELRIYKMQDGKWTVWKKSHQALLASRDGGMMGDPFEKIEIKNGILHISHYGGSSWKWGHTDKYRYQDGEFYLIGYSSISGKFCEYWTDVDFNLSTGKMVVKKEYEDCETSEPEIYKRENETAYEKGIKITLQNRNKKAIKIVTPKYKHEIHIAIKYEYLE